ncbi:MAG: Na+/H+ antiporter subunit E [Candidatus Limivicinus sp.]|nr:Na+/H+ antiporter subunit E [Candidatus Limivicinus sp.]
MQKTRFPAVLATFIVSYAFWILLTWSFSAQELIVGAVVSLAVALFSARFFIHERSFWLFNPLRLLIALFYWLGVFMVELFKANWDMAKRCFGGCKKVNPGIVKVPVDLKSDYAQAALANSITLTPGTITMDIAEEDGQTYYYIHWIDVQKPSGKEAGDAIKGTLEKWLRRVWE